MQQIVTIWSSLSLQRRVVVVLATVAMFAAVLGLSRMASHPGMALLYSGLESGPAGEVVQALETRGIAYEVRGDAIYVDQSRRDELRLTLAAEGLPTSSTAGYELLDGMSGFGTTSQMFDAAYWRAKEGELARTIVASPHIRSARVHISAASAQPFRRDQTPTASVTVTTASGSLSPAHTKALKFLVASAVTGLKPEDVAVIDSTGGLMMAGDEDPSTAGGDRAADLKANVERLLEARVGYGNAVVEVSVETETSREQVTEKRFDPTNRVAISTDTEERSTNSKDQKPGAVTVASNLPDGDAKAGGQSSSQNSETRERTNFEVSETHRDILKMPGSIRRLTVAVLVDGVTTTDASGTAVTEPRSDEEMASLRELVASAVGYDEARGDVVTLKSLVFEPIAPAGTSAEAGFLAGLNLDAMTLLQLGVLSVVALVLGLFVVRPILGLAPAAVATLAPPAVPGAARSLPAPGDAAPGRVLTGEIDDGPEDADGMTLVGGPRADATGRQVARSDGDPVKRLRRLIEERQDETVQILRNWMEDREENA